MILRNVPLSPYIHVLLCFILIKSVTSSGFGKCPVYPQIPNFNPKGMAGTWYEVERSFYIMEMSASCVALQVEVSMRSQFLITVTVVNRWTQLTSVTYGIGIPTHAGSSQFRYKVNNRLPYVVGRMLPGAGHYYILSTDYTQYAIIWSCSNYNIAYSDNIWVLGREREISASVRALIYRTMEHLSLDPDRLIISKNANCDNTTVHELHIINK